MATNALQYLDAALPLNMQEQHVSGKTKIAMDMLGEILTITSTTRVPFLKEAEIRKLKLLIEEYQNFADTKENFSEPMDDAKYEKLIDSLIEISIGLTSPHFLEEERGMREFSKNLSRARRSLRSLLPADYKRSQNYVKNQVFGVIDGGRRLSDHTPRRRDDLTGDLFGPIEN